MAQPSHLMAQPPLPGDRGRSSEQRFSWMSAYSGDSTDWPEEYKPVAPPAHFSGLAQVRGGMQQQPGNPGGPRWPAQAPPPNGGPLQPGPPPFAQGPGFAGKFPGPGASFRPTNPYDDESDPDDDCCGGDCGCCFQKKYRKVLLTLGATVLTVALILVPVILLAMQQDPELTASDVAHGTTVTSNTAPSNQDSTLAGNAFNISDINAVAFANGVSNIGQDTYGHGWEQANCGWGGGALFQHTEMWTFDCFLASSAMVISVILDDYPYQCRCRAVHSYLSQLFGQTAPPQALVRPSLWSLLHHWLSVTNGGRETYTQPTSEALAHFDEVRNNESAHLFATFVEPSMTDYANAWGPGSDAPSHTIQGVQLGRLAQEYKYNLEARAGYCENNWREVCFAIPGKESVYVSFAPSARLLGAVWILGALLPP